ncbi:transcription regulator HTH, apses-type DNA-binding domain-containing protein [Polychytrium aggregatum]|uniref:transcription regulator HTH, apses-type DNA-binding domain-containing protein n=1 Tax=Polychytrium aggregatum TaxID=110093 RepID=UPI0022FE9268|nr:transcription regulator HTH, apses-type DNA-binding domain-containing protein [Polychytrium aggregatum]KAI9208771.1 transcription regulator HTH, apses-type DNA-binding domain-containing protein [Polychytrium aggregatum]
MSYRPPVVGSNRRRNTSDDIGARTPPPKRRDRTSSTPLPPREGVYEATYSNVPVWEIVANGVAVMRRRVDGYVNATHLLKVAGIEKGRRTKILEREIHGGEHEKVQGGYGKYQGTWIPLDRAIQLAREYSVEEAVHEIFEQVPTHS